MRNIRLLGSTELCETKCVCHNCVKDCDRCDGCGDYNYIGECDRFESRFASPKKGIQNRLWNLVNYLHL